MTRPGPGSDRGPAGWRWHDLRTSPASSEVLARLERGGPPFLDELTRSHRDLLAARWPHTQWVAVDREGAVAAVRAVAVRWDGTYADAPDGSVGTLLADADPGDADADTLAVVDVRVARERRGHGLGAAVLAALDDRRRAAGLARSLLLVRPHSKRRHPLVPFARYLAATDATGRPHDGWLAAAWAADHHPVRGVDRSLVARAPVAAWERWYGGAFPTSGPYLVDGAIKPAIVELERDEGRYREPHLWMAPRAHLVDPLDVGQLRDPTQAWRRALARAGVVPGSRRHREVRRRR